MFNSVNPKQSFPDMEKTLMEYWKKNKTFKKSVKGDKDYVFYDGPPFATGLPHYGHLLAGTIKDVVPRYWTMQGYKVERKWGWDCHGLPIENMIEAELELKNKQDIETYGVDKFNEACRASVLKYEKEWRRTIPRMGRWVDMENSYKTMELPFMESIWWVFKQLHEKGMIYEGYKAMHICPRCVTPLSNFEVTQGYKDVKDLSVIWKFPLKDDSKTFLLAWTTTPWSTPGTMGLSIGPEFDYVKVKIGEEFLIFAKERLKFVMGKSEDYKVLEVIKGKELVGLTYEPILGDFKKLPEVSSNKNVYQVFAADYVEVSEGTGIVTINGAYGEIDMEAAKKNNLPIVMDVDMNGEFNKLLPKYAGRNVKEAERDLVKDREENGFVWRTEPYKHSYPHCWRCDSPLLNYATSAWFVAVNKIKDKMIKTNQKIHWHPYHIKDGRFGRWLEGSKDWAISRTRYWGTPIPIWRNDNDPTDVLVIGSVAELETLSGEKVEDLHKHIVDKIVIKKDGKTYHKISEVFDCWFESGSMPYAQLHYPFENKEKFEKTFPAKFIAEGLDQTRGWFYTLHVLANALFKKPAFQNVIVNGIVLAENGQKMSKRLKNYPDPTLVLNKYGADALRFYMLNSQAVSAGDMRFAEKGVADVVRNMILPIWNSYSFFVTYANIDNWSGYTENTAKASNNKLDQWILAELNELISMQIKNMELYDLKKASNLIYKFVDNLTNWYIRRSRRRFWKSEDDEDKQMAYQTLYTVLTKLCQVIAPFMPFVSEEIYKNLTGQDSVHLTKYPSPKSKTKTLHLQQEVFLAKTIVSLGLAARAKTKMKVRQPLSKIQVVLSDQYHADQLKDQLDTIKEELNIKEVIFIDNPSELANVIIKPNARLLGPKYGQDIQKIIKEAKSGNFKKLENGNIKVLSFELNKEEMEIAYMGKEGKNVETESGILVALDTKLTDELRQEGMARDIIRQIQELRKTADYKVSDRIKIALVKVDIDLIEKFGEYIKNETLAESIESDIIEPDQFLEFDGIIIKVKK